MTNWRERCAELVEALHEHTCLYEGHEHQLVARTRAELAQPYSDPAEERRLGYLKGLEDCAHAALAQPEPEGPTDMEVIAFWSEHCAGDGDAGILRLARFGRSAYPLERLAQTELKSPTDEDLIRPIMWMLDECVYDNDKGEIAQSLRKLITLWGIPAIESVPVSERPWEREGWCNEDGKCWFLYELSGDPTWILEDPSSVITFGRTYSLPYWSLPMPSNQGEHHGQSQSFNC